MTLTAADDEQCNNSMAVERQEISQMVKCRMASLNLPLEDYGKFRFCWLIIP